RHKHVLDLLANERERMKMPVPGTRAGKGDIYSFALERFGLSLGGKLFAQASDLGLDFRANFIHQAPEFAARVRSERTDSLLLCDDQTGLAAEVFITKRAERFGV